VADAHRWAGKGDIGLVNNRGIRAGIRAGEITYGVLYEVQPFANTLSRVRMTGGQVREHFEKLLGGDEVGVHISGVTIGYDPSKPAGSRIVTLRLSDGRTLDDNASYNVIMNTFMATGGSNIGPPAGTESTQLDIVDLDAVVDYIRTLKSPLTPPSEARIVIRH
jgi:5'-nucleotidase